MGRPKEDDKGKMATRYGTKNNRRKVKDPTKYPSDNGIDIGRVTRSGQSDRTGVKS